MPIGTYVRGGIDGTALASAGISPNGPMSEPRSAVSVSLPHCSWLPWREELAGWCMGQSLCSEPWAHVHSSNLTATASKPKAAVASTTVAVWHKSQVMAIEPAARRTRCMRLVYMGRHGFPTRAAKN